MSLPFFFSENIEGNNVVLDEETSRHIVQVLRMENAEHLLLTDGKGTIAEGEISNANKKHCSIQIVNRRFVKKTTESVTIAISLIKNASRFEWFLEKATELGTAEIIPIICDRTERQKFRYDRFLNICKSAMLQSMQAWLPSLYEPVNFGVAVANASHTHKFIAHCVDDTEKKSLFSDNISKSSCIILIGPEGDFTINEIALARDNDFIPVSLGSTRLRTETAGLYAAVVLNK